MANIPPTTKLDVESDQQRQDRLSKLFTQQSAPSPPARPTTFPVGPPSELLSRLQAFLPQIATANEALAQRPQHEVDIENVGEDEANYVEMDLGLGVFNAKVKEDGDDTSSDDDSSSEDANDDDNDDDDNDDDDTTKDTEGNTNDTPSILNIARENKKSTKKPGIEMLEDKPKDT